MPFEAARKRKRIMQCKMLSHRYSLGALTEAEAAFRVHKSDLQIRPVCHHREHRVGAHILVCFLDYVLWKTLAASFRQGGLGNEPRQI